MIRRGLKELVLAPAFFVWAVMFADSLQAQGTRAGEAAPARVQAATPAGSAFDVDIAAPREIEDFLRRHLELMRYRELADLDNAELQRLLPAADRNTRELLATLGYFSPEVAVQLVAAPDAANAPRRVSIAVQPGPATRVAAVAITFGGAITDATDAPTVRQRDMIRANWSLPPGTRFTQAAWDDAKNAAVRQLGAQRYALGQIAASLADIDPQEHSARLSLTLDSGPAYRLGPLQINGLEHYDQALVHRLAQLGTGAPYDQARLLEAQQRLQDSGYFDSVYLSLDTAADPDAAPVLVQLREAKRKKLVLGVGVSTDSGTRLSVEHTNHQLPVIGWRAVSKLLLDRDTQSIGTELASMPDAGNWRWVGSARLKNENAADIRVRSLNLRAGRTQTGERVDRNYFLEYDRANSTNLGTSTVASSISANYAWTQRNFDSLPFPSSGYGLGAELGAGSTLGGRRDPFARIQLHWLGVWSLAARQEQPGQSRAGRIVVRTQGGAVLARAAAVLPASQLFLTGGDASVRGYAFHDIGTVLPNGLTAPGRYLANGSVEWQRPVIIDDRPSDWESTLFIDAGAVADKPSQFKAKVGLGAGVRWNSPVGPLQMDLAYGVAVKRLRLHLSVGFTF